MRKHTNILRDRLGRWLWRPMRFLGWRSMLAIGACLGLMSVAITLLFEPFGTDQYEHPFRTLMLSGYALCFIVPFALFHAADRWLYRRQQRRWFLLNEVISRSLLVLAVTSANWWYSYRVINDLQLTWQGWWGYLSAVSLPYTLVLLPLALMAAVILVARWPEPPPGAHRQWIVRGHNRGETLKLFFDDFLYAEAQQNYVEIHFQTGETTSRRLFRTTLADLQRQLPDALRAHRSILVNPDRITSIEGNARKRRLRLEGVDRELPASPSFDPAANLR